MHHQGLKGGVVLAAVLFGISCGPAEAAVISACAASKTGALRLIAAGEACTSKETLVQWNQAGDPGAPGAAAPSDAYTAGTGDYLPFSGAITVASLNLPAGSYVVHGKVLVANTSPSDAASEIVCSLRYGAGGSGAIDFADARLTNGAPYAAGSMAMESLGGGITIQSDAENPVILTCTTPEPAFAQYGRLDAIAVGALHAQ